MKKYLLTASALVMSFAPQLSAAQDWPNRPVKLVVPFVSGTTGVIARMVADELQATYKQPFVLEQKPGASGIIATEFVAKASPDGYTLLLSTNTAHSVNPHLFKKLPYDPIKDFTPIARFCFVPFVLAVRGDSPFKSVSDLLAYGKANPGKLSYGYANSTGQISGASFNTQTKLGALAVSYKTAPQVLTDLIGGEIAFTFSDVGSSAALTQAGRLRAIAVTSEEKSALMPELPTIATAANLPGYVVSAWVGFVGPAGLPPEVTQKVSSVLLKMLQRKDVIDKLAAVSAEPAPMGNREMGPYMVRQLDVWGQKVRDAGIEPQ